MGSPGTISIKFSVDVNGWPRYLTPKKIAENLNHLSRAHERYSLQTTDRRQTDGRQHIANVNVSSRSLIMYAFLLLLYSMVDLYNVSDVCILSGKYFCS